MMSSRINLDRLPPFEVDSLLETTKVLYRLYGRSVAQKYFTEHFCFDTITVTVK